MTESQLLKNYSEAQIANAIKWADRFKDIVDDPTTIHDKFISDYLEIINTKYLWFYQLNDKEAIVRLYNRYFYYDGKQVWYYHYQAKSYPKPNPKTITRTYILRYRRKILEQGTTSDIQFSATTFSKRAFELAEHIAERLFRELRVKHLNKVAEASAFSRKAHNFKPQHFLSYGAYRKRFIYGVRKFFLKIISYYLKEFNATLDQELLKTIRSVRCPSYKLYNWLASGNTTYRLQMLKAQPFLVSYLLLVIGDGNMDYYSNLTIFHQQLIELHENQIPYPWPELEKLKKPTIRIRDVGYEDDPSYKYKFEGVHEHFAKLLGTVADLTLPLNQILAFLANKPISVVKTIGRLSVYHIGGALSYVFASDFEEIFIGIKLGHITPKSRQEWQTWKQVFRCFKQFDIQNWPAFLHGIKQPFNYEKQEEYKGIYADIREMTGYISTNQLKQDFYNFMYQKASLEKLKNILTHYHRYEAEIREKLMTKYEVFNGGTCWSALLLKNNIQAPNGLVVTELLTANELQTKGQRLCHCVGGYYYDTLKGYCRIISIRDQNKSLATAELRIKKKTLKNNKVTYEVVCWQLRGYLNTPPNSKANDAFNWFMKQITTKKIAINIDWPDEGYKLENIEKIQEIQAKLITRHLGKMLQGYF